MLHGVGGFCWMLPSLPHAPVYTCQRTSHAVLKVAADTHHMALHALSTGVGVLPYLLVGPVQGV
jgi:hypothetical protein